MGISRDAISYIFPIPWWLFVCVILTMSSAHRWSTGDNMSCHCLSNRSNIKRQSSQAARHKAHRTLSPSAPLTFWLKFTHSVTNNFPASKLLGRQKNDSYWAPYGWSHKAHCVLIPPPSLVNAPHCVVSDAAIRMGSIVPLSLNIRSPLHKSCFRIHQWSSQHSEYGIIGNNASSEVYTGHRWSHREWY